MIVLIQDQGTLPNYISLTKNGNFDLIMCNWQKFMSNLNKLGFLLAKVYMVLKCPKKWIETNVGPLTIQVRLW
jgi:hypothetical protein